VACYHASSNDYVRRYYLKYHTWEQVLGEKVHDRVFTVMFVSMF
jgi:hypothetical protein